MTLTSILIGLLLGLIPAILAVAFTDEVQRGREWIMGARGELTGPWKQVCPPSMLKEYERIDELSLHQHGDKFTGDGIRIHPRTEVRKWRFRGYVRGGTLVAVFTPQATSDPRSDPTSYGVIFLKQALSQGPPRWTGGYVRPDPSSNWTGTNTVTVHPLEWIRK
jgi:hypothetical protein